MNLLTMKKNKYTRTKCMICGRKRYIEFMWSKSSERGSYRCVDDVDRCLKTATNRKVASQQT